MDFDSSHSNKSKHSSDNSNMSNVSFDELVELVSFSDNIVALTGAGHYEFNPLLLFPPKQK